MLAAPASPAGKVEESVQEEHAADGIDGTANQSAQSPAVDPKVSESPAVSSLSADQDLPDGTEPQAANSRHEAVEEDTVPSQDVTTDAAAEVMDIGEASALSAEPAQGPAQATTVEVATTVDTVTPVLDEQPAADATAETADDTAAEQTQPDANEDQAVNADADMVQEPGQHSADDRAAKAEDGTAADAQPDAVEGADAEPTDAANAAAVATDQAQPSTEQEQSAKAAADGLVTAEVAEPTATATNMEVDTTDTVPKHAADAPVSPASAVAAASTGELPPKADTAAVDSGSAELQDTKVGDDDDAHRNSPAGPVGEDAGKSNDAETDARGLKRAAPAIPAARGAKLARTSQAAGVFLLNCIPAMYDKQTTKDMIAPGVVACQANDKQTLYTFVHRLSTSYEVV